MRAARLLQTLLLLQNRGRMTSRELADELEVTPRTVLRDVDAMTEAGLPIIVFQGNQGGIELGFNYRTRLTGLDQEEAEALGVLLNTDLPVLEAIGRSTAMRRARAKLLESFPDKVRHTAMSAAQQFRITFPPLPDDVRVTAFAQAVREGRRVRIRANTATGQTLHPTGLRLDTDGWQVIDALSGLAIPLAECGDINVSAHRFDSDD